MYAVCTGEESPRLEKLEQQRVYQQFNKICCKKSQAWDSSNYFIVGRTGNVFVFYSTKWQYFTHVFLPRIAY